MRILLISQYFWPENFRINDVVQGLVSRGHEVIVLTGMPNYPNGKLFAGYGMLKKYPKFWNGIRIYRVPLIPRGNGSSILLFLNYFSFAFTASLRTLFLTKKFDAMFVYEPSPITVGIPAMVMKFLSGKKYHFWVQDLWPESITAAAGIKNKFIISTLNWLTQRIYQSAGSVLVQSLAFTPYIVKQGISRDKIIYLPNSTESMEETAYSNRLAEFGLPQRFTLMFAGNIGNAQSFDTLLEAAAILKKNGVLINWVIIGDGRMKPEVEKKIHELNIGDSFFLLGQFPVKDMPSFFACADALLLSLRKKPIFALTIPSKLQSYMAFGKPVIASIDGEGARIVEEANAGFVSAAEDAEALAHQVQLAAEAPTSLLSQMGANGKMYFEKEFEREKLLNRIELVLQS
jgi:colanic acid biosynthesis glycosyl transferase WcaI